MDRFGRGCEEGFHQVFQRGLRGGCREASLNPASDERRTPPERIAVSQATPDDDDEPESRATPGSFPGNDSATLRPRTFFSGLRPVTPTAIEPAPAHALLADASSRPCEVRDAPHGAGVFATRDIAPGARVLAIEGRLQSHPTRYSIQLGPSMHIEASGEPSSAEMRLRHPWRFLNHSCEPNARVQGHSLLARRPIRAGEQVTFDYTTTEVLMAEPFQCGCGAASCVGLVRGFAHLTRGAQLARAGRLAPHVKALLAETIARDA